MRSARILLFMTCGILVFTGYVNCSGSGFVANPAGVLSSSSSSPLGSDYAVPDANGKMTGYQDQMFRFRVPGTGTITTSGAPSWLTIDQAAHELSGLPGNPQDHTGIAVYVNGSAVGVYRISVVGDPFKIHQWHLTNTGQTTFAALGGTAGEDIHQTQTIRDRVFGEGVKIAVSDTGVYDTHRALTPNLLAGASRNYSLNYATTGTWLGSPNPGLADAGNAHGTAVAGLIAERGWKGFGGRGVAPFAQFAGFLFLPAQETLSARGYLTQGLYDQYAGDFDVFNYSWGDSQCILYEYEEAYKQKIKTGATTLRSGKGAVYVKAAGNEYWGYLTDCDETAGANDYYLGNANFSEETTTPHIIVVGALNASGKSTTYSSPGSNLWISAPGGEFGYVRGTTDTSALSPALLTTDFPGCDAGLKSESKTRNDFEAGNDPNTACEYTSTMNGTSGATPIVSGAIALILSANPNLTARDVRYILAKTADKNDPGRLATDHPLTASRLAGHTYELGWTTNAAGFHFHNWYGFGRVNVDAAVALAKTYVSNLGTQKETNSGTTWKYSSGTLNVAVPAGSAAGVERTFTVTENYSVEAMQVRLSAQSCVGNLGVELTSPSGTKSILMNINSGLTDSSIASHVFLSNAFYGENSAGVWKLKLIGGKAGCTTTWSSWQMNVIGH